MVEGEWFEILLIVLVVIVERYDVGDVEEEVDDVVFVVSNFSYILNMLIID